MSRTPLLLLLLLCSCASQGVMKGQASLAAQPARASINAGATQPAIRTAQARTVNAAYRPAPSVDTCSIVSPGVACARKAEGAAAVWLS